MTIDRGQVQLELPPQTFEDEYGQWWRRYTIEVRDDDNKMVEQEITRPVARTLEEAQEKRIDFYSKGRGWIRDGYKWERDRDQEDILRDSSVSRTGTIREIPEGGVTPRVRR